MNYRRILKHTIRNAQKTFPNASVTGNISDWFARNRFIENTLAIHGLKGDFYTVQKLLDARNEQGREVRHRMMRRLANAAIRQGRLVDVDKLADFWVVGADVRTMKFVKGVSKSPIYNVNKAIKFYSNS